MTTPLRFIPHYFALTAAALLTSACVLPAPTPSAAVTANQNAVQPLFLSAAEAQ